MTLNNQNKNVNKIVENPISCLYLYYKQYETKNISEINFNLIYNFFICIYKNSSDLEYVYIAIAKFTLIYCAIYKNIEILSELEKYFSQINVKLNLFEIINLLCLNHYSKCDLHPVWHVYIININKTNLKIFTKYPFINIIKKILNNDLFYNNINATQYATIAEIINNSKPNCLDKIIINQIMNTNIINTYEYASVFK